MNGFMKRRSNPISYMFVAMTVPMQVERQMNIRAKDGIEYDDD